MLDSSPRATPDRMLRIAWTFLALLLSALAACTARPLGGPRATQACFDPSRLVIEVAIENPSAASQPLRDVRVEGSAWFAFEIAADSLPTSIPARSSVAIPIRANRRAFEEAVARKDPSQAGPPIGRGGPLDHRAGDAVLNFRVGDRPGSVALAFRPRPQAGDRLGLAASALAILAAHWFALMVILAAFPSDGTARAPLQPKNATFRARLNARLEDAAREFSSQTALLGMALMLAAMPLGSLELAAARVNGAPLSGPSCLGATDRAELSLLDGEWAGAAMLVGIALLITHEMLRGRVGRLAAHFAIAGAVVLAYANRGMASSMRGPDGAAALAAPAGARDGWLSLASSALLDAFSSPMTLAAIAFLIALVALHRAPAGGAPRPLSLRDAASPAAANSQNDPARLAQGTRSASTNHFTLALLWVCVFPGALTLPVELPPVLQSAELVVAIALRTLAVIGVHLVCARLAAAAHGLRRGSLEAWSLAAVAVALAMFAALPGG